jgi:hypothetical protein
LGWSLRDENKIKDYEFMELYPKRKSMGKILVFTLSVVLFIGCDRAKQAETTTLKIQLPEAPKSYAVKSSTNPVTPPSGFSGAAPINCYLIAAGGPEDSMSKNKCFSRNNTNPSMGERNVGLYVGAAPAGGSISIDVPSGSNRSVYVVGFYAPDITFCRSFKDYGFPDGKLSDPYLLGEKTGLEMKAGETMDLPINVTYDPTKAIDCAGPDFPSGGSNNGPAVEATNIAAEFYHSISTNQCHPMRVHLYADIAGVQNYNVSHSITHVIGLPEAALTMLGLSFFKSESDCSSSASPISNVQLAPNQNEQVIWLRASNYSATNTPTPISFTSSTGLVYNQNRALYVASSGSAQSWAASSVDYIDANQCHDLNANSVDGAGIATAAADSTASVAITDLNGNPISNGAVIVDNCATQAPMNLIPITGSKLRVSYGLKTPVAPLSNFKVVVTSTTITKGAETIFNPTSVAQKFNLSVSSPFGWTAGLGGNAYAGDCYKTSIDALDAAGNLITVPSDLQFNLNLGMNGGQIFADSSCIGPAPMPLKVLSGSHSFLGGIQFNNPGTYSYDVNSPFVGSMLTGSYNVMDTPATMPGAKIHAVVEGLHNPVISTTWPSTSAFNMLSQGWEINSPLTSNGSTDRLNGIQLNGAINKNLYKSMDLSASPTTTVILFKPDSGTTGKIIEVSSFGGGTYTNDVSLSATGTFLMNGTNTSIPWNSSTWYNIAFIHDGGTNCTIIIQSNNNTPQSYGIACNSFNTINAGNVSISGQAAGSIKSSMLFMQAYDLNAVTTVFNYLNQRYQ